MQYHVFIYPIPRKQAHGVITEFWTRGIFSISKQLSFISSWPYKNDSPNNTVKETMSSERGYECEISCELGKEQQQMVLHKRQIYSTVQTFKKPISKAKHSNLETRIHQNLYLVWSPFIGENPFFYMHFCPGTMTTHAESINSDLQRGLDRRLQQIQH